MSYFSKKWAPEAVQHLPQILFWIFAALLVGLFTGLLSSLFLFLLHEATQIRLNHHWLLYFLPVAGLWISFIYEKYGKSVEAGNNLLIEEIQRPQNTIPFRMIPLVLFGTLATHLFGGSSGREGTAVQMGGSISDQVAKLFNLTSQNRRVIIASGISGGFSAIFGTPLAGALFGLEVTAIGKVRYHAILPCFISSIFANQVSHFLGIQHTKYSIATIPALDPKILPLILLAGALFGLTSLAFTRTTEFCQHFFRKKIKSSYGRAFWGGALIVSLSLLLNTDRYLGLGIPVISESFETLVPSADFLLKILFTAITLGAGFKGGEVTPLFFVGATFGNALSQWLPLPSSLLAGMGFVAVFAGASNTPLACIVMGMELFGSESGIYMALACILSYIFSGHQGIYKSQKIEVPKYASKN